MIEADFISSTKKQFAYYKSLGDRCFDQLTQEASFFVQPNEQSNSIAIIVNHLYGNMQSRWVNFLTEDGEKSTRNRDLEFEDIIKNKTELIEKWNTGWTTLFEALDQLNTENMDTVIYIRNQGHTIVEAINRQLCHYAYHVGQIVFLTKLLMEDNAFVSLSIPKGGSKAFNKNKFSEEKGRAHFTDGTLGDHK